MEVIRWADTDAECKELKDKMLKTLFWTLVRKEYVRSEWSKKWRNFIKFVTIKYAIRSNRTVKFNCEEYAPVVHTLTINAKDVMMTKIKEIEHMKKAISEELVKRGDVYSLLPLKGWVFLGECQLTAFGYREGCRAIVSDHKTDGAVEFKLGKTESTDEWFASINGEDMGVLGDCFLELLAEADLLYDGQVAYLTWEEHE